MEKAMRSPRELIHTVLLDHEQLLILDGGREGRVRVLQGGVWLTEEGVCEDAFLGAGHEARVRGRHPVVQAQGRARLQVTRGGPARDPWWQRLRRLAQRWQLGPAYDPCTGAAVQ
jgi:Protein of unknown function (DUF2917)